MEQKKKNVRIIKEGSDAARPKVDYWHLKLNMHELLEVEFPVCGGGGYGMKVMEK